MDFEPSEIKHISLDVWGTMLTPNPEFAKARAEYLAEKYNLSTTRAEIIFSGVKEECDNLSKRGGRSMHCRDIYARLISHMEYNCLRPCHIYHPLELQEGIHNLFWKYPPSFFEELPELVHYIKNVGRTLSVSSNTNFITGTTIKQFLEAEQFKFDFYTFSDLIPYAKPSKEFFRIVRKNVPSKDYVSYMDILHIGNDPLCDIQGARSMGMHAILVENPDHLVKVLEQFV